MDSDSLHKLQPGQQVVVTRAVEQGPYRLESGSLAVVDQVVRHPLPFLAIRANATFIKDCVRYQIPGVILGKLTAADITTDLSLAVHTDTLPKEKSAA